MNPQDWTQEYLSEGEVHCHKITGKTFVAHSAHQKIEVLETASFGRALLLDGRIQHLQHDEYIYSESIVHPVATLLAEHCRRVLVVGGGPGGVIRELLKHRRVEQVMQVEIDASVLTLTRDYFQHIAQGCHNDPRVQVVIADIRDYLCDCTQEFDLIIHDVSEPLADSPASSLFSRQLIAALQQRLAPHGRFVSWAGSMGPRSLRLAGQIVARARSLFAHVDCITSHTQSYGTSWLTVIGGMQEWHPLAEPVMQIDQRIARQIDGELRLYDGITHHHMFLLPKDVRQALAGFSPPQQVLLTHIKQNR
jgi:spermidine synthase